MNADLAERRRRGNYAEDAKETKTKFGCFFCVLCETFATSAFGCPHFIAKSTRSTRPACAYSYQFDSKRCCATTSSPSMIRLSTNSKCPFSAGAIFQPAPPVT